LIEEADNGTFFLDEVADLSLAGQAKLLRFLESGEFYKIGSTKKHAVRVRIVSATNKNLEDLMKRDLFRKDLFFRLCVVKAKIPSLNERKEDIPVLAKYFLFQFNQKFKKNIGAISLEAENILLSHPFTGNVRELKNIIERAALIAKTDTLTGEDLGIQPPTPAGTPSPDKMTDITASIPEQGLHLAGLLEKIEKKYMEQALLLTRGNESKAARLLKMNHHTFRYKLKKIN